MDINNLTIGQAREIAAFFSGNNAAPTFNMDDFAIGHTVIIRTYSAGVWCGILLQKAGNEVILKDGRRMWQWWCKKSISLSGVVKYGINQEKSRIAPAIDRVWLEAIEIMPIAGEAATSIMEAPDAEAR